MEKKTKILIVVGIIALVLYVLYQKGKSAAAIAAATTGDNAGTTVTDAAAKAAQSASSLTTDSQPAGADSLDDSGILPTAVTATLRSSGKTYPVQGYVEIVPDNQMIVSLPHEAAESEGILQKTSHSVSDVVTLSGGPYAGVHQVWYVYWDERPGVVLNLYTKTPFKKA